MPQPSSSYVRHGRSWWCHQQQPTKKFNTSCHQAGPNPILKDKNTSGRDTELGSTTGLEHTYMGAHIDDSGTMIVVQRNVFSCFE